MHFERRQSLIVAVAFLIPFLLLAGDLFSHPSDMVCGLARRLCLAHPYVDVNGLPSEYWDWSTPSAMGLAGLCSSLGLSRSGSVAYLILLALVLFVVALTARLNDRFATWPLALALAWGLLATRFSFGDSQTILATAMLPWIIMRWCQYENASAGNPGSMARGGQIMAVLLAFFALSMDPFFLLVLFFAETYLILASGRLLLTLPLALLASLACYFVFAYGYLPWRLSNCLSFDEALVVPQSAPDQSAWFYALGLGLGLIMLVSPRAGTNLPGLLFSVALAGMVLFILEGSGLSCDLQLMAIYLILATVSAFAWERRRPMLWLCGSVLVSSGLWVWLNQSHSLAVVEDMSETLQRWSRPSQTVAVYADWPQSAYPLLLNSGRQSGYLSFARPLRLPLEELKAPLLARLAAEIGAKKAALILLESPRLENLFESYRLVPLLKANYRQVGYCMRSGNSPACECPRGTTRFSVWVPL